MQAQADYSPVEAVLVCALCVEPCRAHVPRCAGPARSVMVTM